MAESLTIERTKSPKTKPDFSQLAFGKNFTDHMFVVDYVEGEGWIDPRIVPYQPLTMDPSSLVFHYGQAVFEGMKAYYSGGNIMLFRPEKNFERLNQSNRRMSIPEIDEQLLIDSLKELVSLERDWIPRGEGQSLYIRPFVIATEASLSVKPSSSYKLLIILTPVGSYYGSGGDAMKPVSIYVENEFVRSVRGGVGFTKTAGNYAASLKAQEQAGSAGYDQVLWLDGVEQRYIEEVGSMNIFFKISGKVVTPALNGSILEGITRDSVIELLHYWDIPVEERRIDMEEIRTAYEAGTLEEIFGTGTAAVISPVGKLRWDAQTYKINDEETGPLAKQLYDTITGIQTGDKEDVLHWTRTV